MLEKARLAERLIAERDQAQERFERYSTAVDVSKQIDALEASPPVVERPAGAARGAGEGARRGPADPRDQGGPRRRGRGQLRASRRPRRARGGPTAIAAMLVILRRASAIVVGPASSACSRATCATLEISAVGQTISVPAHRRPRRAARARSGVVLALIGRRQRIRAQDVRTNKDLRAQEIERRLRGRSMLEQELQMEEVTLHEPPRRAGAAGPRRRGGARRRRGGAHRQHPPAARPARGPRRARADGDAARPARPAALDIEQKTGALEAARADRPRAARSGAAGGRGHRRGSRRRAWRATPRRRRRARVEQNAVDAEEVAGHAEKAAVWAEQLDAAPAPRAGSTTRRSRPSTPRSGRRSAPRPATSSGGWSPTSTG